MPSVSKKQHNLMALVANDPKAAKRLGIPQSVGRDFMKADKGHKFNSGGFMKYRMRPMARGEMEMPMRRRGGAPMTMRKGGKAESPEMVRKEIAFMKKKGAPKSMVRHEEEEMGGKMKKGVRKFDNGGPTRGGPTTRVPTGPTAPRYGYLPNPFGQDIRYKKGPSGVSFPKKATTNPRDIFGNENPDFNRELAEYEEAMRQQQPKERARGGKIQAPKKHRYAAGGSVHGSYRRQADGIASKGKTRGKMVKMAYGGKC